MSSTTDDYDAGYDPKLGYNKNVFEHRLVHVKAIGHVVKDIGLGIGLVSKAIHYQKDKRKKHQGTASSAPSGMATNSHEPAGAVAPSTAGEEGVMRDQQQQQHRKSSADGKHGEVISDEPELIETDETGWALDELTATPSSEDDEKINNSLTIPDSYKPATISNNKTHLPYPIIIPQRRPSTKTRRFVHAYTPVLSTHVSPPLAPVDFNAFLASLQRAARASPVFDAVLLTAGLVGVYPGWIALAVTTAAQVAVKVGQEMQERWQVNKALEKANREIWGPRGLWAMVVKWVPEEGLGEGEAVRSTVVVDMSAVAVVKNGSASGLGVAEGANEGEVKEKMKRLRVASGKTNGEEKMPIECAQLVFPEIDEVAKKAAVEVKEEGKEVSVTSVMDLFVGKARSSSNFVNEYSDRRAAMEFVSNLLILVQRLVSR